MIFPVIGFLIIVIIWIIWKIVVATDLVLTATSDKPSYAAGEDATLSGKLTGDTLPVPDATLQGAIVFPGGVQSQNFTAVTDINGDWQYIFDTTGKAQGTYTVQVALPGSGAQATATFQQIIQTDRFDYVECLENMSPLQDT